ncbi:MAG TPA: signal peptidase I [Blastocatellia bacterium]|jgi:signal peptidase I|nr:signal peptidase I [Blastocatellia bacterium]
MSENLDLRAQERRAQFEAAEAERLEKVRVVDREPDTASREEREAHSTFKKGTFREYVESAVVTLIMALFGMTFIVQAVKVPTGSMKNTILIQDHLLVNKFIFGSHEGLDLPIFPSRSIRRGDVIVFKYPEKPEVNYVKRVIGLPGETIEFNNSTHRVFIDGQELPEHRVYVQDEIGSGSKPLQTERDAGAPPGAAWIVYYQEEEGSAAAVYRDDSARYAVKQPFRVPMKGDPVPDEIRNNSSLQKVYDANGDGKYDSDQYFAMGDNRDDSEDSRYWGSVPRGNIVGRAMFVYWSIDRDQEAEGSSNFLTDFFTKSRWSRTGTFIK